jgi:hypothetical protein
MSKGHVSRYEKVSSFYESCVANDFLGGGKFGEVYVYNRHGTCVFIYLYL